VLTAGPVEAETTCVIVVLTVCKYSSSMFLAWSVETDLTGVRPVGTAEMITVALNVMSLYLGSSTVVSMYSGVHTIYLRSGAVEHCEAVA